MTYSMTDREIWYDPWFETLDIEESLLWFYLFTTPKQTNCGVFQVSMRTLGFESKLGDRAEEVLLRLCDKHDPDDGQAKVRYWPALNTIWVCNFYKRQQSVSHPTKFVTSARKALAAFPEEVQAEVRKVYPELQQTPDTLPIPTPKGIDRVSTITDQDHKQTRPTPPPTPSTASVRATVPPPTEGVPVTAPVPSPVPMKVATEPGPASPTLRMGAQHVPPALREKAEKAMGLEAKLLEIVADILDKPELTRSETRTVRNWFARYKDKLTAKMIDDAEEALQRHKNTPEGKMAYFYKVLERMITDPDDNKPRKTMNGGAAPKESGVDLFGPVPPTDYSWDFDPDRGWLPMERNPKTGLWPFGCASRVEAVQRNREAEQQHRSGVLA